MRETASKPVRTLFAKPANVWLDLQIGCGAKVGEALGEAGREGAGCPWEDARTSGRLRHRSSGLGAMPPIVAWRLVLVGVAALAVLRQVETGLLGFRGDAGADQQIYDLEDDDRAD